MTEDTPLTVLCAICHTGAPKYTCPRCSIHTCSLPCVKLHKIRASCSGIRDPAAYRKRSELTTASSIDSDFNFITSLERSLARSEETAAADGSTGSTVASQLQPAGLNKKPRPRQTDSARLERLVKDSGVLWRRAPRGMRRRQENETRVEHSGVTWTLEFVFADGNRRMVSVPEGSTVGESLERAVRPVGKHLGKRKRGAAKEAPQDKLKRDGGGSEDRNPKSGDLATEELSENKQSTDMPSDQTGRADQTCQTDQTGQSPDVYADQHIYIHRPNTPSKFKVLAPTQRSDVLRNILKGRVVMEYPTFYIKAEPPDALLPPFITEQEYLQEHGEDVVPLAETTGVVEQEQLEHEEGEIPESTTDLMQNAEEMLRALADTSKVVSVLQQDLVA